MQRLIYGLARLMALLGGIVLVGLILLTCISVTGRGANSLGHADWLEAAFPALSEAIIGSGVGPLLGDFEIVEAGIAFSIFAFLPWCQLRQGHAVVDIFTAMMPGGLSRFLITFWDVLFALVLILISWRLYEGLIGKFGNGQTTFLLQFPIWWAYAASFAGSVVAALTGVYVAVLRLAGLVTGRHLLPVSGGSAH